MHTSQFYSRLPLLTEFADIGKAQSFAPLPSSWHVVMCDVRNSTAAVEAGQYKDVNTVGAAVITAVLNAAGEVEVPFVFEGDGAALCVPPALLEASRAALLEARAMALDSFGLDLRIATLAMSQILEAGFQIQVARYRVSDNYIQAVFSGGGMAHATAFMKSAATEAACRVPPGSTKARANFAGLECRWRDIPSRFGEIVNVIVSASADGSDSGVDAQLYSSLIGKVRQIYGSDDSCHPVFPPNMSFSLNRQVLSGEVGVQTVGQGKFAKWRYLMKIRLMVALGWVLMRFGIKTADTDWGHYKTTLARNSDVRKFNDCFCQVLAGTTQQRMALEEWLEGCFTRRELVYGIHVSDRAQITCMVFDYAGRHLHFIDGAGGGYFMAAKALKQRLASQSKAA